MTVDYDLMRLFCSDCHKVTAHYETDRGVQCQECGREVDAHGDTVQREAQSDEQTI